MYLYPKGSPVVFSMCWGMSRILSIFLDDEVSNAKHCPSRMQGPQEVTNLTTSTVLQVKTFHYTIRRSSLAGLQDLLVMFSCCISLLTSQRGHLGGAVWETFTQTHDCLEKGIIMAKPSIIGTLEKPLKYHFLHLCFQKILQEFGIFLKFPFPD